MKRIRAHLSYANVLATLALFIAVAGGTAFAATQMLPKNSVGTKQIKKDAVSPAKLSKASKARLVGATGPKGDRGETGAKGPEGAAGATHVVVREEDFGSLAGSSFTSGDVFCEPGEVATGGGAGFGENGGHEILEQSRPIAGTKADPVGITPGATPTGWFAIIRNNNVNPLAHTTFYVVCAKP
jgi:hypothetical protein